MHHRLYWGLGIVAALLCVFGVVADDVIEGDTRAFDEAVLLAFRVPDHPKTPIGPSWLVEAAREATALGSFTILAIVVAAVFTYLMIIRRRATALLIAGTVLGGTLLSTTLKTAFARQRPELTGVVEVFTPSFPSGHALVSAVTFLTLAAILAAASQNAGLRFFYVILSVFLTLLVGITRIYLGVHYPTDVIAGWSLGSAWALACFITARLVRERLAK